MGLLRRIFGGAPGEPAQRPPSMRTVAAERVEAEVDDDEQLVEVQVVGEGPRQEKLAQIAGPKTPDGKEMFVGVTLRCEPANPVDPNAIRVEVMGQHVGYLKADHAALLAAPVAQVCGGALEARGLIVGGWDRGGGDTGHYGIRVWITATDAERLGVPADDLDWSLGTTLGQTFRQLPRDNCLGPTREDLEAGRSGSGVTVTCEEHYQDAIATAMPNGWNPERTWPVLVELSIAEANPHTSHGTPCVQVRIDGRPVGYFTPKMTERHRSAIEQAASRGERRDGDGDLPPRDQGRFDHLAHRRRNGVGPHTIRGREPLGQACEWGAAPAGRPTPCPPASAPRAQAPGLVRCDLRFAIRTRRELEGDRLVADERDCLRTIP